MRELWKSQEKSAFYLSECIQIRYLKNEPNLKEKSSYIVAKRNHSCYYQSCQSYSVLKK